MALEIEIKANTSSAVAGLDKVADSVSNVSTASQQATTSLNTTAQAVANVGKNSQQANSPLVATGTAISNVAKTSQATNQSLFNLTEKLMTLKSAVYTEKDVSKIKDYNSQIAATKAQIDSLSTVGTSSFGKIGNAAGSLFSGLRKIAYLVPGFGLAGLIGLLTGPIISAFSGFAEKLGETGNAIKSFNDAVASGKDEYVKATLQVSNLRIAFQQAREGIISKEEALKLYNTTIGKTTGEVKSLDEAESALAKNAEAYIQFTLLKAAANYALGKAAEKAFEAEEARQKQAIEFSSIANRASVFSAGNSSAPGFVPSTADINAGLKAREVAAQKAKDIAIKASQDASKAQLNIADKFLKDAEDLAKKFKFDFNGIAEPKVAGIKKSAETVSDVLAKLAREISFLNSKEINLGTNEAKNKISAIENTIQHLIRDFKVSPKDTIIQKLFGDIKDLLPGLNKIVSDIKIPTSFEVKEGLEKARAEADKLLGVNPLIKPIKIPVDVTTSDLEKRLRALYKMVEDLNQSAADNIKSTFQSALAGVGESIGNAISSGADIGKTVFGGLFKVLGAGLKQLGEAMIAIGTAKIALEKFKFSPGIGTVIAGIAAVALGALLQNAIPGFANGVQNFGGGLAIVGERGPELVRLPSGSDVIPNHALGGIGSASPVIFIADTVIRGSDIVTSFKRQTATNGRNG